MGKDKDFSLSPDMNCIFFSCVVYSLLKAFGKIKLTEKLAILQEVKPQFWALIVNIHPNFCNDLNGSFIICCRFKMLQHIKP